MSNVIAKEAAKDLTQQIRSGVENLWELIVTAYQWQAWRALGYNSWDAYVNGEFGDLRLRLPKEDRREVMCTLRDHGLSLRAIASATGYDKHTVARDLQPPQQPLTASVKPRKHREFSSSFWTASYDLAKLGSRISKLAGDSRFEDFKERIRENSLRDLTEARDSLNDVIAKLEGALV